MQGNYGVGAVITSGNEICYRGFNQLFHPLFRSDMHAEMNVINKLEKSQPKAEEYKDIKLFTSIEPCPMCMTRILSSKIQTIFYAAEDKIGGMVHLTNNLPPILRNLATEKVFEKARCSAKLEKMASSALQISQQYLDNKLNLQTG